MLLPCGPLVPNDIILVHWLSKYRVHKFGNKQTNERMNRQMDTG